MNTTKKELKEYKMLKAGNLGGVYHDVGDIIIGFIRKGSFCYGETNDGIPLAIPAKFVELA